MLLDRQIRGNCASPRRSSGQAPIHDTGGCGVGGDRTVSDHKGAAIIYPKLPTADMLIGDKGYDSDAFRDALTKRGITPCIRPEPIVGCPRLIARPCISSATRSRTCSQGSRIGGALRYDRCAHTFFSAICIAATVIFWINQ
jgi:hypothetical protein